MKPCVTDKGGYVTSFKFFTEKNVHVLFAYTADRESFRKKCRELFFSSLITKLKIFPVWGPSEMCTVIVIDMILYICVVTWPSLANAKLISGNRKTMFVNLSP